MKYRVTYVSRAGFRCEHPTVFDTREAAEQGIRTLTAIYGDRKYGVRPAA